MTTPALPKAAREDIDAYIRERLKAGAFARLELIALARRDREVDLALRRFVAEMVRQGVAGEMPVEMRAYNMEALWRPITP
jgi:predicted exporter